MIKNMGCRHHASTYVTDSFVCVCYFELGHHCEYQLFRSIQQKGSHGHCAGVKVVGTALPSTEHVEF